MPVMPFFQIHTHLILKERIIFKPSLIHIWTFFFQMQGRGNLYLVYFGSLLFPRFRLLSVLVVVVVTLVVYITGMALKTGVLETHLPDIVETENFPHLLILTQKHCKKYLAGN